MSRRGENLRIHDPLTRRVRSTPDRVAIIDAVRDTRWRYDELDAAVARVADRLSGLELAPGDRLGLLTETSVPAVLVVHAAWRLGLTLVPFNVRLGDPELARQVDQVEPDALVASSAAAGRATALADCSTVTLDGTDGRYAPPLEDSGEGPETVRRVATDPGETALVLFTSGTTGTPKAVRLTMGNLLASAAASAFRLGVLPTDQWLLCLPIYHMGGLAPVVRSAVYGTGLVVREGFEAAPVAATTHEHDVTGLSLVPTMLGRLLDAEASLADSVRTVLLGGAPAPRSMIERCQREGVPVYPTYGLTETASQVATATPAQAFDHPGTVGQPLLGTEVQIVDEYLEPRPTGETGEIVVDGPKVTPGYLDDRGAMADAFCEHGLRTGDLGHVDEEGRLWVAGRLDDRILTGGEIVAPEAVAAALRDHRDVTDAAVVGLPDPEWGERVAALVVPRAGRRPDAEALLAHCRERLAGYEVPKTLAFADELPTTASGTVDRPAVAAELEE